MKKILIVHIHNINWNYHAGFVYSKLYEILKNENIDMLVLHLAKNISKRNKLNDVDLSVHKYPYKIISNFEKSCRVIKSIFNYKPDVLIVAGYNDISYILALVFQKIRGRNAIIMSDSTYFDRSRNFLKEFFKSLIVKMFDAGFSAGSLSSVYLQRLGMKLNKIFITPRIVADDIFIKNIYSKVIKNRLVLKEKNSIKTQFNFIYVGRLSEEKNIKAIIEAFSITRNKSEKSKAWGLIIVGSGHLKESLTDLTNKLNLKDVYFIPEKPWKEVIQFYILSDVFVLASTSEPWGLVVNEAMMCGLPVIVSKRAGASHDLVFDYKNGFKFNPLNVDELANVMLRFINNEVDVAIMGYKSREIIQEYTPEKAAKKMFQGINNSISK